MKILIVSQYFWPEHFQINTIATSLQSRGHVVDVVTGVPNYPEGRYYDGYKFIFRVKNEFWNNISLYRMPIFIRDRNSTFMIFINYLSFIFSVFFIAPFALRSRKYDLIFVYGVSPIFQSLPASFLGFLKRAPVVLWVQDLWPESAEISGHVKSSLLLDFIRKIVNFTYRRVDLILVQSKAFIPILIKSRIKKPIVYHPNTVDDSFYLIEPFDLSPIPSLDGGFNVVFAGNIGEAQSLETVVATAVRLKSHPEIKIVLFGAGSKVDWVKSEINRNGLTNLILEGRYPVKAMPVIMSKASALLLTLKKSGALALTVPNKLQAYLAVGRPIVACLDGEGSRLVDSSGAGITVPAEDDEGLFESIIKIYNMSDYDRDIMGANGRNYFKSNFDGERLTDELVQHFSSLIMTG
jgi:glycosyltransferase involved in cell wall biosynthesis